MADRKYQFERLTPTDSVDLNVYGEAIDYVFDNPDIKNVAISGAYSAGKSSVLASYKKQHNDKRFLHISLAHFTSPDQEDELEIKESVLEGKILNQLIHQIPAEKIPQTNFRVKRSVRTNSVIGETLGFVLFVISIIFLTHLDTWKDYVSTLPDSCFKSILAVSTQQYASIVVGLIVVLLSALAVYRLIRIRLTKLIPDLLTIVEEGRIALRPAVELSYLGKLEQQDLAAAIGLSLATSSHAQAIKLRTFSKEGKLSPAVIESIMCEEKPNQKEKINIKYAEARKYIFSSVPYEQTGAYILKALEYYHRHLERQRGDAR